MIDTSRTICCCVTKLAQQLAKLPWSSRFHGDQKVWRCVSTSHTPPARLGSPAQTASNAVAIASQAQHSSTAPDPRSAFFSILASIEAFWSHFQPGVCCSALVTRNLTLITTSTPLERRPFGNSIWDSSHAQSPRLTLISSCGGHRGIERPRCRLRMEE